MQSFNENAQPLELQLFSEHNDLKATSTLTPDGDELMVDKPFEIAENDYVVIWPNNLRINPSPGSGLASIRQIRS